MDESTTTSPQHPQAGPTACRVELNLLTSDCSPPLAGWIEPHLTRIAATAGVADGRLSIALVDDLEMARLHERYTGVPGTTDVLTFDLREQPNDPVEGDIVICRSEAERQAAQRGHEVRLELLLYGVHGLLHLLGHDDHDPQAAAEMHRREDELLTTAGLGSVFAAAAST